MKPKLICACVLFSVFSACSTIRMRYDADIETAAGKTGTYRFEKSYDVSGGQSVFCGLSAIFFGGACWFYLVMPTTLQISTVTADAEKALNQDLGNNEATIQSFRVKSSGWNDAPLVSELNAQ